MYILSNFADDYKTKIIFDDKNELLFNNLMITYLGYSDIKVTKKRNLAIWIEEILDKSIVLDIVNGTADTPHITLSLTKSAQKNKMIFLQTLHKFINILYKSFVLMKKYNIKLEKEKIDSARILKSDINVLDIKHNRYTDGLVEAVDIYFVDDDINSNNTIVRYCYDYNNVKPPTNIVIKKNIISLQSGLKKTIVFYPYELDESLNILTNRAVKTDLGGSYVYTHLGICFNCLAPKSFLLKFLKNIKTFENIRDFKANSEYDLCKYV